MASPTKAAAAVERAASFRGPHAGGGGNSARVLRRLRHLGRAGAAVGRRDRARPSWHRKASARRSSISRAGSSRRSASSEGSQVEAGDVIVVLDDTRARADYNGARAQLVSMLARSGRLAAEQTGAATPAFADDLVAEAASDPAGAGPDGRRARQSCRADPGTRRSGRHARRQDRAGPGGPRQLRGIAREHRPADRADRRGDRHGRGPSAQGAGSQAAAARPAARPRRSRRPAQRGRQQRRRHARADRRDAGGARRPGQRPGGGGRDRSRRSARGREPAACRGAVRRATGSTARRSGRPWPARWSISSCARWVAS